MRRIKLALALIVIAVLVVFVVSNTQTVSVRLLTVKLEAPLAIVAVLSSVAGVALWPFLRTLLSRPETTH